MNFYWYTLSSREKPILLAYIENINTSYIYLGVEWVEIFTGKPAFTVHPLPSHRISDWKIARLLEQVLV